jgi:hypothetical protein
MNDVLTRATCDFEDDTLHRQDIAKDIKNEIAITYCRGRVPSVIGHFPRTFDLALALLTPRAFVAEASRDFGSRRLRHGLIVASLSQPRDLSGREDNGLADRLGFALQ